MRDAELVKDFDAGLHQWQVGLGAEDDADDWAQTKRPPEEPADGLPSECTTWRPDLSTSNLIGLLCNIRAEKSPRESYLPGPGQRLLTRFGHGGAKRGRRHDAAAIGHEPLTRLELGAGVKDQRPARDLREAFDRKSLRHGCIIGIVPRGNDDRNGCLGAPAQVGKVREPTLR